MANILTGLRMVCAVALLFCPTFSVWFFTLYLVCGLSDVLDGVAARRFGQETPRGAQLDTMADTLFTAVVLVKVFCAVALPIWLLAWVGGIALIKCLNGFCGFLCYQRFLSEHTILNKICGILLFAVPFGILFLPRQLATVLMMLTCAVATVAAIQEGHYIRKGKEIGV